MTQDIEYNSLRRTFLKLGRFRSAEKYTDVTIKCGDECYKCHRVTLAMASTFFDCLFDGFPEENASVSNSASSTRKVTAGVHETFVLDLEIPHTTEFKRILPFIYSGLKKTSYVNDDYKPETHEYFGVTGYVTTLVAGMTLDTDSAKLRQLYSRLEEFRVAEKYTDVTIECRTKCFKCHRVILAAASEFFDNLFGSRKADIRETFVLDDEVRLEVFEPILKFIYCGEITIDSSNIYSLLRACEYFRLTGRRAIFSLCEKFTSGNRMSSETTTDTLRYADDKRLPNFSSILRRNITKPFASCSKSKEFLSKSGDTAEAFRNKPFLEASSRWKSDLPEEIVPDQNRLTKNVSEANVAESITQVRPNRPPEIDYRQVPETNGVTAFRKYLKAYLRNKKGGAVNIFSIDDKNNFNLSGEIWMSARNHLHNFRTVALNEDRLYCIMHYRPRGSQDMARSFFRCSSADLSDPIKVKNPPIVVPYPDLHLCATKNDIIYVYSKFPCYGEVLDEIHYYSCSLNDWFPMPPLKKQVLSRCATTQDDILYLFEKSLCSLDMNSSGSVISVQTYDRRVKKWLEHPFHFIVKREQGMTCCANDTNRIYVHTGRREVVSYDITAQKWDRLPRMKGNRQYSQLVSYSGKIWAMGNLMRRPSVFVVEVYDNEKWEMMDIFTETANDFSNGVRDIDFLDAVVFR